MKNEQLTDLQFKVINEDELTFLEHNEIHKVLNLAYSDRTNSFLKKTYGYCEPLTRILCYNNDTLVGHTAIFMPTAYLPEPTAIGGIGLTLSLLKGRGISHELRKRAAQACASLKLPFAVGRVKNEPWVKRNLADIVEGFLDVPLIGKSTRSHAWETLAIYSCQQDVTTTLNYIIQQQELKIEGEVF